MQSHCSNRRVMFLPRDSSFSSAVGGTGHGSPVIAKSNGSATRGFNLDSDGELGRETERISTDERTSKRLSLKEWMAQAQAILSCEDGQQQTTQKHTHCPSPVASKKYLTAALEIACSLAFQLRDLESKESSDETESGSDQKNIARATLDALASDSLNWSGLAMISVSPAQEKHENKTTKSLKTNSEIKDLFHVFETGEEHKNYSELREDSSSQSFNGIVGTANHLETDRNQCLDETKKVRADDEIMLCELTDEFRGLSSSTFSVESIFNAPLDDVFDRENPDRNEVSCINGSHDVFHIDLAQFNPLPQAIHREKNVIIGHKIDSAAKIERIYSFGLVLYELFSGGLRPPELSHNAFDNGKAIGKDEPNNNNSVTLHTSIDFSTSLTLAETTSVEPSKVPAQLDRVHFPPSENLPTSDSSDDQFKPISIKESNAMELPCAVDIFNAFNFDDSKEEDEEAPQSNSAKRVLLDTPANERNISLDPLRSQGLPACICDIVVNVFDAVNGDLSGEDAYKSIGDVLNDLEWAVANLDRILDNTDINKLITKGLRVSNLLYGRSSEMSKLMEAYENSRSGSGVSMALISGPSGSGKSRLAQQIATHSSQVGGHYLAAKFDQLQQTMPYSAISSAFNDYCGSLVQECDPHSVAMKLWAQIGPNGVGILSKIIPSLKDLYGHNICISAGGDECVDAQKRLQHLLGSFVEIVCDASPTGLMLFLDDLQWADASSTQFIHQLLMHLHHSKTKVQFFVLGCFRDGEHGTNSTRFDWIDNVQNFGIHITRLHLGGIGEDSVNTMISDILCLPPRLTRPFSDIIYHKTQGNPLFLVHLLKSLTKEGLLYVSTSRRRWEFNLEKINERGISDDVAMVLTDSINSFPLDVIEALCIVSCFGASMDNSILQTLQRKMKLSYEAALDIAVKAGLLVKRGSQWHFPHDIVQEAAYKMMKPEERCLHHFSHGLSLSAIALEERNDDMLLTAVDQLNRGGPKAVSDKSQIPVVAELNLNAGNLAAVRSDFSTAFSFFDYGISYLRKGHWKDYYELSLNLFVGAVKCTVITGDIDTMTILTDQVLANAASVDDKLPVLYATVRGLEMTSKFPEAIEKAMSVLDQLGVKLVNEPMSWKSDGLLSDTKSMLMEYDDSDILRLKHMVDPNKTMAMKILARMQSLLGMANPESQPEATLLMVQLSLSHGISSLGCAAFAWYGSLLASLGDNREGHRYVKIAFQLLDRTRDPLSKEAASEAYAMGSQVKAFMEPIQSLGDVIMRGHKIGLETGDTNSAMLCLLMQVIVLYWGGNNLQHTRSSIEDSLTFMKQYNNVTWVTQLLPLYRSVLCLTGEEEGVESLIGKVRAMDVTEKENSILNRNLHLFKLTTFNKMYIAFVFRRLKEMKDLAEKYLNSTPIIFFRLASHSSFVFYEGLVCFLIAREGNESRQGIWYNRGSKAVSIMRDWSDCCSSWNFQHKLNLLEAEQCHCTKNIERAKHFYEASISAAKKHKFVHEEALACELAGYFFLECDENSAAHSYFMRSCTAYKSWGATAKADALCQFIEGNFK